jgi:hypothetical protein
MSQREFMTPSDVVTPTRRAIHEIIAAEGYAADAAEHVSKGDHDKAILALREAAAKLMRAERAVNDARDEKAQLARN